MTEKPVNRRKTHEAFVILIVAFGLVTIMVIAIAVTILFCRV